MISRRALIGRSFTFRARRENLGEGKITRRGYLGRIDSALLRRARYRISGISPEGRLRAIRTSYVEPNPLYAELYPAAFIIAYRDSSWAT